MTKIELVNRGTVFRGCNCPVPNQADFETGDVFVCGHCGQRWELGKFFSMGLGYVRRWVAR